MVESRHRAKVLQREGLTPNDAKALIALDETEGRTMSAISPSGAGRMRIATGNGARRGT